MNHPVRIGIFGARGRMGKRLIACADSYEGLTVQASFDQDGAHGRIEDCDVLIDFSLPEATSTLLELLRGHPTALVTGVTGRTPKQEAEIQALSQDLPLFQAANFSLGIAVLNHLVRQAVQMLGSEYDTEVFEVHHRKKEDAPSGTALLLAETASQASGYSWPGSRTNRDGHTGPRGESEIGTAALRGGTVAGEHTVYLFGAADRLELTHRATDRDVFAHGALRASVWLSQQPPGHYGMSDLLGVFS